MEKVHHALRVKMHLESGDALMSDCEREKIYSVFWSYFSQRVPLNSQPTISAAQVSTAAYEFRLFYIFLLHKL